MQDKIFRANGFYDSQVSTNRAFVTVKILTDAEGQTAVSFSAYDSRGKRHELTAQLDTIKRMICDYKTAGVTVTALDEKCGIELRYTKGGLSRNDRHTTISICDTEYKGQITLDASALDTWLRSVMRKENYKG